MARRACRPASSVSFAWKDTTTTASRGASLIARRPPAGGRRPLRGLGPGVAGGEGPPRRDGERCAGPRPKNAPIEGRRHCSLVPGVHEERGVPEDLALRGGAADDEGHAAGGGLEGRQAEALVLGEGDRDVGGGVTVGERGLVDEGGEAHLGLEAHLPDPSPRDQSAGARAGSRRSRPGRGRGGGGRGGRPRAAAPARSGGSRIAPTVITYGPRIPSRARASWPGGGGGRSSSGPRGTRTALSATSGKRRASSRRVKSEQTGTNREALRESPTRTRRRKASAKAKSWGGKRTRGRGRR